MLSIHYTIKTTSNFKHDREQTAYPLLEDHYPFSICKED